MKQETQIRKKKKFRYVFAFLGGGREEKKWRKNLLLTNNQMT